MWQALLDQGVLIREVGPDGWLRVSAGTPAEMPAFKTALTAVLERDARQGEPMSQAEAYGPDRAADLGVDGHARAWTSTAPGESAISTGVGFYDHMLTALAKHSLIDLEVTSVGDWGIDAHHTVEDTAIVLGQALRTALGDKEGIRRFGDALVPLDEALAQAVVDVSGRPYCVHSGEPEGQQYVRIGGAVDREPQRALHRLADPARAGDTGLPRPSVPARHPAGRAGPAPHRGVPVQGRGPGPARCGGVGSAGAGGAEHQGPLWWRALTRRGPGLRLRQPSLRRAGGRPDRGHGDRHRDRDAALAADGLVVPGVGAFAACMSGLVAVGGRQVIAERRAAGRPTLAICVGHQVLFEAGIEHGVRAAGCAVWPGVVERLQAERLPHMGWNTVTARAAAGCSPAWRPSGSTSCTATASAHCAERRAG